MVPTPKSCNAESPPPAQFFLNLLARRPRTSTSACYDPDDDPDEIERGSRCATTTDDAPQLRGAGLRRRRLRGLRREESVLHSVASITEAYMRPLYHAKADRLEEKADRLENPRGCRQAPRRWRARGQPEGPRYAYLEDAVAHIVMGLGGESDADTDAAARRRTARSDDAEIGRGALTPSLMRQDAFNHKDLQTVDGHGMPNGMAVMAMGAHTGCNTVLRLDAAQQPASVSVDELAVPGRRHRSAGCSARASSLDHARRSVILPERLGRTSAGRGCRRRWTRGLLLSSPTSPTR